MSSPNGVISHWSTLIENFQASPQQFYKALTDAIEKRKMPNAKISRMTLKEGHLLSAKREYLRISCGQDFYFAVCGAPYGTGFFISWWLLEPPAGCLAALFSSFPLLSGFASAMVKPWTYYRMDTASMFQTAAHSAVTEVIDAITSSQGLKGLSEAERQPPVMQKFFER